MTLSLMIPLIPFMTGIFIKPNKPIHAAASKTQVNLWIFACDKKKVHGNWYFNKKCKTLNSELFPTEIVIILYGEKYKCKKFNSFDSSPWYPENLSVWIWYSKHWVLGRSVQ